MRVSSSRVPSLFQQITAGLADIFETKSNWRSLSGWRNLMALEDKDIDSKIALAVMLIGMETEAFLRHASGEGGKKFGVFRQVTNGARSPENQYERVLVESNENFGNRFNFLSGLRLSGLNQNKSNHRTKHMTVDLVESNGEDGKELKINAFVELKVGSNTSDSPLSAMCEVVMYHFLYQKMKEMGHRLYPLGEKFKLIVRAPGAYYEYYEKNNSLQHRELLRHISMGVSHYTGADARYIAEPFMKI